MYKMAPKSTLMKVDCQYVALHVLHMVVVHGHEVVFYELGFLKHEEVQWFRRNLKSWSVLWPK
jgi:hypothetical protein